MRVPNTPIRDELSEIEDWLNQTDKKVEESDFTPPINQPQNKVHPVYFIAIIFVAVYVIAIATQAFAIDVCKGGNRAANRITCIYDGDTGWENGVKWRTLNIDTPEINSNASCKHENTLGHHSRDRLINLMNQGYQIVWSGNQDRSGRELVDVLTIDGTNTANILKLEGLAQDWPNSANVWCN